MVTRLSAALAAGLAASLISGVGQANTLTLNYNYAFSGTSPSGSTPWIVSTFNDGDTAGSVTLTMNLSGLTSPESVKGMYFNLDPNLAPANLTFTHDSGVSATSIDHATSNGYPADGSGYYDILFNFKDGGGTGGFNAGDTSVYTITGINSLTTSSFNFPSVNGGGQGHYVAAAQVQNINGAGVNSGWVAPVPLPSALWLFGSGLLGVVGVARRRCAG